METYNFLKYIIIGIIIGYIYSKYILTKNNIIVIKR